MNIIILVITSSLGGLIIGLIYAIRSYPKKEVNKLIKDFIKDGYAFGEWMHFRELVDHNFRSIVKPNCETLYSTSFISLNEGDFQLTLPQYEDYFSVCFLNKNTDVIHTITNKDIEEKQTGKYLLTKKNPSSLTSDRILEFPNSFCWLIVRYGIGQNKTLSDIHKMQDQVKLELINE